MRFAFLNPPAAGGKAPDRNYGCNYGLYFQHPINILYPATVLKEAGHEVSFIDAPVEGRTPEEIEKMVREKRFDVYVFFTVFLSQDIDKLWSQKIKKLDREARVLFIGSESSYRMDYFLEDERTFVIRGEPEKAILEFVKALKKGRGIASIRGLSWVRNGKKKHNAPRQPLTGKELNGLPFPDRTLIRSKKYYNIKLKGRPTTTMITSRGCSYRCIYCIPSSYAFAKEIEFKNHNNFRKPPVAMRSAKSVIDEFKLLKNQGYRSVSIMDEVFTWTTKRTNEICDGIKDLGMEWGCLSRANLLQDEEMLKKMEEAGCRYIDIGVESFDKKILDYIKKDVSPEVLFEAIEKVRNAGIEPKINILLGASPLQTKEDIVKTVETLKKLDIETVSFSIVIPHPMTEFYKIVKQEGWFSTNSRDFEPVDTYREATVDFPDMSHEELEKLVKWAYRSFYLRPEYIVRKLKSVRKPSEVIELTRSAMNLFFGGS